MFWNKKVEVVEEVSPEAPTAMQPKPAAPESPSPEEVSPWSDGDGDVKEWLAVASKLGIIAAGEQELLEFLREEGIGVYNFNAVVKYLDSRVGRDEKWRMWPLRSKDAVLSEYELWSPSAWPRKCDWVYTKHPDASYRDSIPLPVLLTVTKLLDRFGDRVRFYVLADNADPFLAVTVDKCHLVVIERWGEPEFRDQ